jgi:hypothetical protein
MASMPVGERRAAPAPVQDDQLAEATVLGA